MKKEESSTVRANPPPLIRDEQPLLKVLVAEATKRGESLASLAKSLGVTYVRLAQWRRNEANIANAHRGVHEKAAQYLGVPTVLVLMLAGTVGLQEFVWPGEDSLKVRVGRELERLRQDPYLGPFVPRELAAASPAVKLFVTFLFHELDGGRAQGQPGYRWLTALHQAAIGNAHGQSELQTLRQQATESQAFF
jgi:hypothetical protein